MNTDLIKLAEALKDIKFTMFTTIGDDGNLYSRPMATL
jgi:general stress protein 26